MADRGSQVVHADGSAGALPDRTRRLRRVGSWWLSILLLVASGCVTTNVPRIGEETDQSLPEEVELRRQADEYDKWLREQDLLVEDEALDAYLTSVAAKLVGGPAELDAFGVHVHVLKHPFANAFATPNGGIYLHSSLLARLENEAQLATVIGHELIHFFERHSLKELRSARNRETAARAVIGALAVLAAAGGGASAADGMLSLGSSIGNIVLRAQMSGYSQDLEREADAKGIELVASAGYDTAEAPAVFVILDNRLDGFDDVAPYKYSSHPSLVERAQSYRKQLSKLPGQARARVGAREYSQAIADLLLLNAEMDLTFGRPQLAEQAAARNLELGSDNPRAREVLAEARLAQGYEPANVDRAIEAYADIVRRDPDQTRAYLELGLLYRARGDREDAIATLNRYLALDPEAVDRPIVEFFLAELTAGDGNGP